RRPADPAPRHRGRRPRRRRPDAPHRPGQEGEPRPAHLHPVARRRPRLPRPRRRSRRGGGVPGGYGPPMSAPFLSLALAVLLLAANAFFVAAEFALVKARGFRIEALAGEKRFGAELTRTILVDIEAY